MDRHQRIASHSTALAAVLADLDDGEVAEVLSRAEDCARLRADVLRHREEFLPVERVRLLELRDQVEDLRLLLRNPAAPLTDRDVEPLLDAAEAALLELDLDDHWD